MVANVVKEFLSFYGIQRFINESTCQKTLNAADTKAGHDPAESNSF